jgi:hypothetical protein
LSNERADEAQILAYMALLKERNRWANELRKVTNLKTEDGKTPDVAIEILKNRVQALEDAISKYEEAPEVR